MNVTDQDDRVTDDQPADADKPNKGRESERVVRQEEAEGSSGDRERQCGHDNDRVQERTELDEKNQEDQHDGSRQHVFHLAECLLWISDSPP